jgi:SAM-dependent methyltransferase
MEHIELVSLFLDGPGVEIGAFQTPIPGIKPVYVDRFSEYAGEPTLADYYGDACELPFFDSSLQYVATSHVLEHVANPLAALSEWFRVLCHDGIIYMVIPDIGKTFDHTRPLTTPEHMLADFRNQTTQIDGTHIDELVYGVDWSTFSPDTRPHELIAVQDEMASVYRRAIAAGSEINIHFHTFTSASAVALIEAGNLEKCWNGRIEILQVREDFPGTCPNGFLIVAKVRKPVSSGPGPLFTNQGLLDNAL